MFRYFIKLGFDGTNYHGWQFQRNARTIQQVLADAVSMMLRSKISLTGCGRTDSGVHASVYYAHFETTTEISESDRQKLVYKLNSYLGEDIVIYSIFPVGPGVHARFSATARTYKYFIARYKNPFLTRYRYYLSAPLDSGQMNRGAKFLLTVSDFSAFSKVSTDTRTSICHVTYAQWNQSDDDLVFTITSDRFLRNMVRAIVGTLLDLGSGRISYDDFTQIVAGKNRSDAGESAPASGLFLVSVEYPESLTGGR
jgi:tRNA pseudouridine38-40 synthase